MIEQKAEATWQGSLREGKGSLHTDAMDAPYTFASRFEGAAGSTPEELIGAAHAGCFSMAFALVLGENGHEPTMIRTTATVRFDPDELAVAGVSLETEVEIDGLDDEEFQRLAQHAKEACPVSKALSAIPVELTSARLAVAEPH